MDFSKISECSLTKPHKLEAIAQLVKLLQLGEDEESELRELAPGRRDKSDSLFHPTVAPGMFFEMPIFQHMNMYQEISGLDEHMQEIVDSGRLFEFDFTKMNVNAPEWLGQKSDKSRTSLMFAALYTLQKSIQAIKTTSWPINHFISKGRTEDRSALKLAVKLDIVAITAPTIAAEIMKSDFMDKGSFRRDLQNALRYPYRIERVNHGKLRFILRTMHDDGMLTELSETERYEFFCKRLRLYPDESFEAPDSLNRFIRGCVSTFRT